MTLSSLPRERRMRVIGIGVAATVSLYVLFSFIAEPARTVAATDSETAIVSLTVAAGIGLSCDANGNNIRGSGETLNIGTITFTGDTQTGSSLNNPKVKCRVLSSSTNGYTLGWHIAAASNNGSGTGHLTTSSNDLIAAFNTGHNVTNLFSVVNTDSRWAGRVVVSRSSGSQVNGMNFGTDAAVGASLATADASERWARVATGSTFAVRQSTTRSQSGSGDLIQFAFRAAIGASKVQPTGTYTATVTFTATGL